MSLLSHIQAAHDRLRSVTANWDCVRCKVKQRKVEQNHSEVALNLHSVKALHGAEDT